MKKQIFIFAALLALNLLSQTRVFAVNMDILFSGYLESLTGSAAANMDIMENSATQLDLSVSGSGRRDSCVGTGLGGSGSVDIESGQIYTVEVNCTTSPCDEGLYVSFDTIPPGYLLEFNLLTYLGTAPAAFDDNQLNTAYDDTFWNMSLLPKRIYFSKNSVSPDGKDMSQAKLPFITGTGDWFGGSPTWSIVGDNLGCTIDSITGWIQAGTQAGEITVRATDSGTSGNFLSGTLKIGCAACMSGTCGIGAGACDNATNALAVDLGVFPDDGSSMGSIRLKLTAPAGTLATPAGLTYDQTNSDNALPEIINDPTANTLRQVLAPQCLADVVTITDGYEIRLYSPSDIGSFDTSTGLYPINTGAVPFKVWRVTSSGTGGTPFTITEDPTGSVPDGLNLAKTFTWDVNASDNAWTMAASDVSQTEETDTNGIAAAGPNEVANSRRSETKSISVPGTSGLASKVTQVFATLSLNSGAVVLPNVLVQERVDGHNPDGSAANPDQVTAYFYTGTATPDGHPELERMTNSDGSWEHYVYDSSGRITDLYQPWLDQAPPSDVGTVPNTKANKHTQYQYTSLSTRDSGIEGSINITPRTTSVYVDPTGSSPQLISQSFVILTNDIIDYPPLLVREDIQGVNGSATSSTSGNLTNVTRTFAGGANSGATQSIDLPDGTRTVYTYAQIPDPDGVTTNTVETVSQGAAGNGFTVTDGQTTITTNTAQEILKGTKVTDILSGLTLVQDTWFGTPDAKGRFPYLTHLDGTTESYTYNCCSTAQVLGKDGETTVYNYDSLNRPTGTTVWYSGDGSTNVEVVNTLDAAGNATGTTRTGAHGSTTSSINTVPLIAYDRAGRVVEQENALAGPTTTTEGYNATSGEREVTTTYPDGGTRIEDYYFDGQLARITGTAVNPVAYGYGIDATSGDLYTTVTNLNTSTYTLTTEWTKTLADFLGRSAETVYSAASGSPAAHSYYNPFGQLTNSTDPDGVATLSAYNPKGEQIFTATDINQDGGITFGGDDRVTWTTNNVRNDHSTTVQVSQSLVWDTLGVNTPKLVSSTETSADGLQTWQTNYNGTGTAVVTHSQTVYGSGGARTQTTTAPDGSQTITVYSYGRQVSVTRTDSTGMQIGQTTYNYDIHGRQGAVTDVRNGTTVYGYNNADLVTTNTTPSPSAGAVPQTTLTTYDTSLRATGVTEPDGTTVTSTFFPNGQLEETYGSRTYPVAYTYDYAGRMSTMTTWQNFATSSGAAVTTWNYDAYRGFLTSKIYADTHGPSYTYTAAGRLATRTWARSVGGSPLVTSYVYDTAGGVTNINYSDGTTLAVSTLYDRLGRAATNCQGSLVTLETNNLSGQLLSESYTGGTLGGLAITNAYDADLRRTNLVALSGTTPLLTTAFGYDNASRLQTVADNNTHLATYSYIANSPLVGQIAFGTGGSSRMTTIKQYDYLNRLTGVASTPGGTGLQPVANTYTYNLANQRTGNTFTDGSHWEYQYDSLGQVTNATRYWVDGTLVAGQQYAFAFDTIGNRLSSSAGGNTSGTGLRAATYAPNNLNEYSTRSSTTPWEADILGDALSGSTVTVNSSTPDSQHGQYFWKALAGSTTTPDWLGVSIVDGSTTVSGNVYLPPETETYHYDLDGNLTNDARWFYFWDAENRLVRMDTLASTAAAGIPAKSVRYSYDYLGRMISRTVFSGTYGSGSITWATSADTTATANVLFLYDGFQCVAELSADQSVYQTYVWGADLSGSLSGAGGVGGLLMFQQTGTGTDAGVYFPTYDGNGNVTGLVKGSDGTIAATYEYGPFGNVLRMSGGLVAADNPFRFSSKWQDYQSDLLYYGYRFYSADTGRWLNRDPLQEKGGGNLYGFIGNSPEAAVDRNGLDEWMWIGAGPAYNNFQPATPEPATPPALSGGLDMWAHYFGYYNQDDYTLDPSVINDVLQTSDVKNYIDTLESKARSEWKCSSRGKFSGQTYFEPFFYPAGEVSDAIGGIPGMVRAFDWRMAGNFQLTLWGSCQWHCNKKCPCKCSTHCKIYGQISKYWTFAFVTGGNPGNIAGSVITAIVPTTSFTVHQDFTTTAADAGDSQ